MATRPSATSTGGGESYFVDESNRVVPLTVAIYEDADGNVDTVQPRAIRFTGPRNALEAIQRATGTLGSDL